MASKQSTVPEFDNRAPPPKPAGKGDDRPAGHAEKVVYPFNQQTQRPQ